MFETDWQPVSSEPYHSISGHLQNSFNIQGLLFDSFKIDDIVYISSASIYKPADALLDIICLK